MIKKCFLSVYVNFLAWPVKEGKKFHLSHNKTFNKIRVLSVEQSNSYIREKAAMTQSFLVFWFFWTFLPLGLASQHMPCDDTVLNMFNYISITVLMLFFCTKKSY